jgi:predicted deacetylase
MAGQLIVSVSGIRAETLPQVQGFAARLSERAVPLSYLVAPRLKGGYRLAEDDLTCEWLRQRRAGDDAIVLHGYNQVPSRKRRAEFAELSAHEAGLRLLAADRVLEHSGLRTRIFAAPRWNASPGARSAMPIRGFRTNLGSTSIDNVVTGTQLRARVVGIGDGLPTEPWWCRLLVANTVRIARRGGVVRLSVAAKHLEEPVAGKAILDCIDLALLHGSEPQTYRSLTLASVRKAA